MSPSGQDPSGICRRSGALTPPVRRLAVLSLHTSPLAQPGAGDGGGMNVYVRELVSALAQAGVECNVYVRTWRDGPARRGRTSSPGSGCVTSTPARPTSPKEALPETRRRVRRRGARRPRARRRRRRHPRELLALGPRRAPAQARARPPARVDVPHARPGQGRVGRRRARATRARRARDHRLLRRDPRVSCTEEAAQFDAPLRRRPGSHRDRAARRRPRVLLARRSPRRAARALGLGDHPVLLFVGRIQPLKGLDVAVRALAALERIPTQCSSSSAVRAAATATPSSSEVAEAASPSSASPSRSGSCRRSPTICSRATTAPPTCASCRAAPSRSGSSRSRPPRAARRSSRRRSAGLRTLVDHGALRLPGRGPRPRGVRGVHRASCSTNDVLAADMSVAAATGAGGTRGRCRRGPAPPALRRPHRRRTRRVLVTCSIVPRPTRSSTRSRRGSTGGCNAARRRTRSLVAVDRGEPGERAVVRAAAGRGEGLHDHLAHARPAHVAVRDVRDAGARGEPRRVLRAPAAAQREARRRAVLRSAERTRCTSSAQFPTGAARRRRARPHRGRRSMRASSSASDRPSASGSPRDFPPKFGLTSQCISCHSALGPRAPRSLVRGSPVTRCALGSCARRSP